MSAAGALIEVSAEECIMKSYVLCSNRDELTVKHLLQRLYITRYGTQ